MAYRPIEFFSKLSFLCNCLQKSLTIIIVATLLIPLTIIDGDLPSNNLLRQIIFTILVM